MLINMLQLPASLWSCGESLLLPCAYRERPYKAERLCWTLRPVSRDKHTQSGAEFVVCNESLPARADEVSSIYTDLTYRLCDAQRFEKRNVCMMGAAWNCAAAVLEDEL